MFIGRSLLLMTSALMSACIVHHHHHYGEGATVEGDAHGIEPWTGETTAPPSAPMYQDEDYDPAPLHPAPEATTARRPPPAPPAPEPEPEPAEVSPKPVEEQQDPPRWNRPPVQAEADETPTRPMAERMPTADTSSSVPSDFLPACRVTSYPSGWIMADCRGQHIILITGPAARRSDGILASLTIDQVARQVAGGLNAGIGVSIRPEGEVTLAGNTYPAQRITASPREPDVMSSWDFETERPTYRGSGLFTVARADVGKVALACHQRGALDEERCLSLLDGVLRRGLSDVAPRTNEIVSVAGVPMVFRQACHYNGPTTLVCQLAGSLHWFKGSPAEARQRMQQLIRHHQNDHGFEGFHNPLHSYSCTIGGHEAQCHEIWIQGVLDAPLNVVYGAVVDTPDGSYQFHCQVHVEDEMNEPCRLLLAGVHSGRWHQR